MAALRWLRDVVGLDVRAGFTGSGADLRCESIGIEVKTLRVSSWDTFGPVVSAHQIERIRRNSKVLLYVRLPDGAKPDVATMVGWLPLASLYVSGRAFVSDDLRAEIAVPEDAFQSINFLVDHLRTGSHPAPARAQAVSGTCRQCQKEMEKGFCWWCCPWPTRRPDKVLYTQQGRTFHVASRAKAQAIHENWPKWAHEVAAERRVAVQPACVLCMDSASKSG